MSFSDAFTLYRTSRCVLLMERDQIPYIGLCNSIENSSLGYVAKRPTPQQRGDNPASFSKVPTKASSGDLQHVCHSSGLSRKVFSNHRVTPFLDEIRHPCCLHNFRQRATYTVVAAESVLLSRSRLTYVKLMGVLTHVKAIHRRCYCSHHIPMTLTSPVNASL